MKKVSIEEFMSGMAPTSPSKLLGVDASNNACMATPANILKAANNTVGYMTNTTNLYYGDKWYRIAAGLTISQVNSAILNISHRYNTSPHEANLFFILASGSGGKRIMRLDNDGTAPFVNKMRILYKGTDAPIVDVMFNFANNAINTLCIAYACNMNFTFQMPVEVPDAPDEGYSVKEFTFE